MPLSYKTRRRLSLVILLVGMPMYILVVSSLMAWFGRLPALVEFLVYALLGLLWIWPFKAIFRGVGQADPADAKTNAGAEK